MQSQFRHASAACGSKTEPSNSSRARAGYPFFVQELGAAAWATRDGDAIAYERVRSIVPGVRRLIDESLYEPAIDRLTGPELAYAFALAALGPGPQRVGDIAASLGKTSASANWLRNQLIKKDVIYSPAGRSRLASGFRRCLRHDDEAPSAVKTARPQRRSGRYRIDPSHLQ
jgi:hypothetical protein